MLGLKNKSENESEADKITKNELEVCNIAHGTTIEGQLKASSNIRLDGIVKGDVSCAGKLVMSATAKIIGNISCKNFRGEGVVEGDIVATHKIHLMNKSIVKGNIQYQSLQIDLGATLNGKAVQHKSASSDSKSKIND